MKALDETAKYKSDPKHRLLQFVQLFIDAFEGLDNPFPGCLYASFIYEYAHFSNEIKEIVASSILMWREAMAKMIKETIEVFNADSQVDTDSLTDHFTVILEGAFIVSKSLNDPDLTAKQLTHYRNYLQLIFEMGVIKSHK
jgi:TetR/AcrR family transcriptional repressor of nem operon